MQGSNRGSDWLGYNLSAVPSSLLRFFREEGHALQFLSGNVRVGLLTAYRETELSRRDEQEGETRIVWRGGGLQNPVYCDHSSLNPYYILSTSSPDVDRKRLASKFGKYVVSIHEPRELLRRLQGAWERHPLASGRCILAPVAYNKGDAAEPTPGLLPPVAYNFLQKPALGYEEEMEFRYVLTCTADTIKLAAMPPQRFLTLSLPCLQDVCSVLLPKAIRGLPRGR